MPKGVYTNIKCTGKNVKNNFSPTEHQKEAVTFFLNSPYKGLLLYHKLGSGKTCTGIMIADKMLKKNLITHVYVLTPGSLREGWINEYCKVCGKDKESLSNNWTFVTYNYAVGNSLPIFTDSLVIIDEVHNLINGVKNMSTHATKIYEELYKSNARILALSGTPVFNYIWEFPLLGRLLKPKDEFNEDVFDDIRSGEQLDTFSFTKLFTSKDDGTLIPKNVTSMKRKLDGIISYYPGAGYDLVPRVYDMPIIRAEVTRPQEENYWAQQTQEEIFSFPPDISLKFRDKKLYELLRQMYIMSKKNILTRASSNFYYPGVFKFMRDIQGELVSDEEMKKLENLFLKKEDSELSEVDAKTRDLDIETKVELFDKVGEDEEDLLKHRKKQKDIPGWINKEYFKDRQLITTYSGKITALLINIVAHNLQKHVVFTFFKTKSGVQLIRSILAMCGIESEIFSGDLNDKERRHLLKRFNDEDNRYGDKIRALLVTEAGAEGITILEARHVHILESSPRMYKTIQAIGRVARFKSHVKLPVDERNVKVWRYWSVASPETVTLTITAYNRKGEEEKKVKIIDDKEMIDEKLYRSGIKQVKEVNSFLELLQSVSVTSFKRLEDDVTEMYSS